MQIVRASIEDAHAIARIHVETWRAAYEAILPADYLALLSVEKREVIWRDCIASGAPELSVARHNSVAQGFIAFGSCRDAGAPATEAEVWAIYVAPTAWSTGAGRMLWLQAKALLLEQRFTSCSLWVLAQNARAIKFYRAAGFARDALPLKEIQLGGVPLQEVRYVCKLDHLGEHT